jgi:hypothetical protein
LSRRPPTTLACRLSSPALGRGSRIRGNFSPGAGHSRSLALARIPGPAPSSRTARGWLSSMLGVAWAAWATHGPGGHPVGRGNRSSLAPDARAPCTAHRGPAHFAHSAEEGSSSRALLSAHLIPNQTLAWTAACSGTIVEGPSSLLRGQLVQDRRRGFEREPSEVTNLTVAHRILNPPRWPAGAAPAAKSRKFRWLVRRSSGSSGSFPAHPGTPRQRFGRRLAADTESVGSPGARAFA